MPEPTKPEVIHPSEIDGETAKHAFVLLLARFGLVLLRELGEGGAKRFRLAPAAAHGLAESLPTHLDV